MLRRNMFLSGAVLWLTACGGQAVLKTDQQTYSPGSTLSLRLENDSLQPLGFNLCYATLMRHEGETWTPVVTRADNELCLAAQYQLEPGSNAESHNVLADTLPEGEYRYLTNVEWGGEREDVVSNAFNVTRASTP